MWDSRNKDAYTVVGLCTRFDRMTAQWAAPGYAPFGLPPDSGDGFDEVTVRGALGSAVARHRRTSSSTRATIFLHGAAGSWTTWIPLLRTAEEAGIRIDNPVLIDLPGWGSASLTARADEVTIDAVCAIVKDSAEELGYTEWDIVGHSMGGFIALHMASIWPQSVMSVGIISGTGPSIIASVRHPIRKFAVLPAFTMLWAGMGVLARLGPVGGAIIRALGRTRLLRAFVSPLFRFARRVDGTVVDALGRELRPLPFTLAAALVGRYDIDRRWPRIECEVRALNGDRDVFSTRRDLQRLAELVPHSVITVVRECGHFAAIERPGEVLVALGYALP